MLATTLAWFSAPAAQAQTLAEVSIADVSFTETNAGFRNVTVTFTVTGPRSGPLSVTYDTFDTGSATADVDYRDFSQVVTIYPAQNTVTRAIRIFGDTEPEPTETFEIRLSNPVNATIGQGTSVFTIIDNDGYQPPVGPTISVADASVTEGDGPGTVNLNLSLSEPSATPVTVDVATSDGSAVAVDDYQAFSDTLTFPANQTSITQPLTIVGDTDFEPTETFTVNLTNPSANATIDDGQATVTITDNDPEPPGVPDLSVGDVTVGEGDGTATVTITADETAATPVTFELSTGGGSATAGDDYTAIVDAPLTLPANTLSITQSITIVDDALSEPPETFNVTISDVAGGTIADGTGVVTITDNDAPVCASDPQITIDDITVTEAESLINALVTFRRSYSTNSTTRFYVNTIDGTATAPGDYVARSNQLIVIKSGQLTKTLAFKIVGDTVAELPESFQIQAFNPTRGCIDPNNDTGTVTILDNDGPPIPAVSVSDASTTETDSTSSVNVTVSLDDTSLSPVTVSLSTADGSATGTNDFVPIAGTTVTIPAGSLTATVPIDIIGDTVFEPTESFTVNLSSPAGAFLGDAIGTVTILDNDPAPPAVSVADASTTETDATSSVDVTVSVDQASASPITVLLSTADDTAIAGEDYVAITSQLVTIPANTTSVVVPIDIVGDDDYEPTEAFGVTVGNPTNAIIGDGSATITILDDEDPPPVTPNITVADATTAETDGASSVDVIVSLSEPTSNTVTVDVATADGDATNGDDYTATGPTTLTFAPNETSKTVTIPIIGDDVSESTETFTVNLSNPSNGVITDAQGEVTITDDDAPACTAGPYVTVDDLEVTESNGTKNVQVTFRRSYITPNNQSTRFFARTVDGTATSVDDYIAKTSQLVVINGQANLTKTLVFKVRGDTDIELTEQYTIELFNPTRACIDPNNNSGTVTILDDDSGPDPLISVSDASTTETDSASSVSVTVSLDKISINPVTVQLTTADDTASSPGDYIDPGPTTVTIPAGQTSATVPIGITGDDVYEQTETFTVNLTNPVGAAIGTGTATVTIFDDEDPPPAISIAGASTTETDSNSTVDVTVSLATATNDVVTALLSTADGTAIAGSDYQAVAGQTVTIPAGQTSVTVPLTIIGDEVYEQTESFTVSLSAPINALPGTMSATVTIDDDEDPPPNVSVADTSATETDTNSTVDVTVSLDKTTGNPVTVELSTSDGTATAGDDYLPISSQLVTIPANTASVTVPITIVGDDIYEQTEAFNVSIANPTNAFLGDSTAVVGILDDEIPPPGVSISDATVTETDANITVDVTINLDDPAPTSASVELTTVDGTAVATEDFVAIGSLVVDVPVGQTSVTVPITIVGDTEYEQTEEFTVTLANAVNLVIGDGIGSVTITDNDPIPPVTPDISISDATTTETDGPSSVDVTVSLSEPTSNTVTVDVATADGEATSPDDYIAVGPTTLTFNPGQTSQTVTIGIVGDTVQESQSETFTVGLSNESNGVLVDDTGLVTIVDNDGSAFCGSVPQITVNDVSIEEGDAFTRNATMVFSIPFPEPNNLSVRFDIATENVTATAPSDFNQRGPDQLVVIPAGETTKEFNIVIKGDTLEEGDETLRVRMSNPLRGCIDPNDDFGVVTIIGDDGPPKPQISIADATTTETDAASTVDVTLSLDIPSNDPITVQLDTVDGTAIAPGDYIAEVGTIVTFPANTTTVTETIDIAGDTTFELSEEFQVALSSPSSNAEIDDGTATVTIDDNDVSPDPVLTIANAAVTEGDVDVTATVTVTSSQIAATPITVDLTTASGTATSGVDFTPLTAQTVTIPAGQLTATQDITIIGDELDEGTEEFTVTISNPSAPAIILGSDTATVTITDDDGFVPVNPQLRILDVSVEETDGTPPGSVRNVLLTFELLAGNYKPAGQATFMWETIPTGSASQGDTATDDYPYGRSVDPSNPTVDLPVVMPMPEANGAKVVRTRTLKIYGDTLPEPDETFEVHLFDVTNSVDVIDGVGVVTIIDNDGPPSISIDDVTVNEGQNATLTLSLDRAIPSQIDVQVDTADDTAVAPGDYTAVTSQIVSFPANTLTTTIDIPAIADNDFEGSDEQFFVNLSNPVNADLADTQAVVTIVDLDGPPQISITDVTVVEPDSGVDKSVFLNITLNRASTLPVTLRIGTIDGTAIGAQTPPGDFKQINGSTSSGPEIVFAPGETLKTFSVRIFGDDADEDDETFTVQLYSSDGVPLNATFLDDNALVTIIDNDTVAGISIDDLTVLEGDGNTSNDFVLADATLNLDVAVVDPVSVQVDSADGTAVAGTDYEAIVAQTVTFPANSTTATVQVKVFSNDVLDGNRDFVLNLSNPINADLDDSQATITIDDNEDLPKVSVSDLTVVEGDGSGPVDFVNADVVVSLDSPATAAVTVDLDTADGTATAGTDYEAQAAVTVTIPAGATSVTQPIKVFGDTDVEADETFTVTLSNQSANADPGTMSATVTIEDNEVIADISITSTATVTEGNTGFVFAVLTATLSEASNLPASVDIATSDGTATGGVDYEVIAGQTVTIPAGSTSSSPIFVKVFGDLDVEGDEDLTVTMSNPVNVNLSAATTATVTIQDDDVAPQISIDDATVTEGDTGTSTLDLTLSTDIAVPQNVTVELATADGTATAGQDYQALNGAVATFTTGNTTTTASVTIIGDTTFEGPEEFTVNLGNPVNGVIADGSATVTIQEDDPDPSKPNIRVEDIWVSEGDANQSNVELVFVLEEESENNIRAVINMEDITATSGIGAGDGDYVPVVDLPLIFPAGERIVKRVIKINGDNDFEGNETARIIVTQNTTETTNDDANLLDPEGILTILDSEVGPGDGPKLYIADVTQQEGGNIGYNNVEVTFVLDEPSGAQVLFDVAAADGNTGINDATLAGGDFVDPTTHLVMPIVIPPGSQVVKRNFRVNGDTLLEGNEVFRLLVQNIQGATIGDGEGIVTILDTDLPVGTPGVGIIDVIDNENGDSGDEIVTVKFYLDRPHDQTVTVDWSVADGTLTAAEGDYLQPDNPEVVFLPGEQIAERNFRVIRDNTYGGVEFARPQISNATGGAVIVDSEGIATVYDDEQPLSGLPGIHMLRTDLVEGQTGAGIANIKGYIDKPFIGTVEATFGFIDGTAKQGIDYVRNTSPAGAVIRWTNGVQVSETKVNIIGDNYFEGNENFQLELLSVTGQAKIVDGIGDITILDNEDESDPPEPSFNDADVAVAVSADKTTANGGETVTYTVDVTNNGPDDANAVEATLDLPAGLTITGTSGCANISGTTCTIGTMANGTTSSFTVTATVDLITSGVVTATATASTIDVDSPTSNNTDTVDVTAVSPYENDVVYVSVTANGSINGFSYTQADILSYDRATGTWALFFDSSDLGVTTLDGFHIVDFTPGATIIDFSMTAQRNLGGSLGLVDDSDVIRFVGTTGTNTSGTLSLRVDGTDLQLTTSAENIDVVAGIGAGDDYLISTTANMVGNGLSAKEQDLVLFEPTALGDPTSGTFSLFVDGSTIDMSAAAEDVNGAWVDPGGDIFLTTVANLSANGFTADLDDIVILTDSNAGTFLPYFDGDTVGLVNRNIDGIHIVRG